MELVRSPGVYRAGGFLYTPNLLPGTRVYGEELRTEGEIEYRRFDPDRSKLAAWVQNGGRTWPFQRVQRVLYLGASHGTTVSHVSDILPRAHIYAVEKSPRAFAGLLNLAQARDNVFPILADAQLPERYRARAGDVDLIYQDLAQRNQTSILVENARACLKPHGFALLQLKTRSVTQTRSPRAVLQGATDELERDGFRVQEVVDLAPFSRDHFGLALQWEA